MGQPHQPHHQSNLQPSQLLEDLMGLLMELKMGLMVLQYYGAVD